VTTSTWAAICDRVVAQLNTIANIGKVHDHTRLITSTDDFVAAMTTDVGGEQKIRAWMIHEEIPKVATWEDQGGNAAWDRLVVCEGFLQLEDASSSERTAIALAELVIRALNTDVRTTKLGGTVLSGGPAGFPNGHRPGEPRIWGPLVCNYIRVDLPVFTIESPS